MKYAPDADGRFAGQDGYGYRSIADFVDAAVRIRAGTASTEDFNGKLATINDTIACTAILEAGRRSLDAGGKVIHFKYDNDTITGFEE